MLDPLTIQKPAKENRYKTKRRQYSQPWNNIFSTDSSKTLFHIKLFSHLGLNPELEVINMFMHKTQEKRKLIGKKIQRELDAFFESYESDRNNETEGDSTKNLKVKKIGKINKNVQ